MSDSISDVTIIVIIAGSALFVIILVAFIAWCLYIRGKCPCNNKAKRRKNVPDFANRRNMVSMSGLSQPWESSTDPDPPLTDANGQRVGSPGGAAANGNPAAMKSFTPKTHRRLTVESTHSENAAVYEELDAEKGAASEYSLAGPAGTPIDKRRVNGDIENSSLDECQSSGDEGHGNYFELEETTTAFNVKNASPQQQRRISDAENDGRDYVELEDEEGKVDLNEAVLSIKDVDSEEDPGEYIEPDDGMSKDAASSDSDLTAKVKTGIENLAFQGDDYEEAVVPRAENDNEGFGIGGFSKLGRHRRVENLSIDNGEDENDNGQDYYELEKEDSDRDDQSMESAESEDHKYFGFDESGEVCEKTVRTGEELTMDGYSTLERNRRIEQTVQGRDLTESGHDNVDDVQEDGD